DTEGDLPQRGYDVELRPGPSVGSPALSFGVSVNSERWITLCYGSCRSRLAKTLVSTTPGPSLLLAIALGSGYLLDVRNPREYEVLPLDPICAVTWSVESGYLLLASFTDVACVSSAGLAWLARDVSQDGIMFERITRTTAFARILGLSLHLFKTLAP